MNNFKAALKKNKKDYLITLGIYIISVLLTMVYIAQ
ncbi:hypothetical protein Arnit_3105 [Arcobacter nitrofigilis DSM 7299]|uniref:Uncharacterized protein n=1 Tax=Arcobacter nitrofigilis (strain ATCC 33309 / DSM 7299 / CCUG 15893 / LMG 7604 / NCTC 12251 / CI) TaxID=572480 RepID=D5V7Y2_ARCNC|nr:hypothetical protein Arnit_3105 [Arcobacter nitrofigilis DSM 7299]